MPLDRDKMYKIKSGYTKIVTKIFHIGLDYKAIVIYIYLCSCVENFNPSISMIKRKTQISRNTIINKLLLLEEWNIINKDSKGFSHKANIYRLIPPEDWKIRKKDEP